jgi:hypothetical protein
MNYIKLLKAAVEDARDVCKYLDAGMVEEAKAHTEFYWAALDKIRDMDEASKALAESRSSELQKTEQNCKTHPDAPHGFCRNASLSEDRYVCECEFWEPPQREWIGLTDAEIIAEMPVTTFRPATTFARAIEAKLREKNT